MLCRAAVPLGCCTEQHSIASCGAMLCHASGAQGPPVPILGVLDGSRGIREMRAALCTGDKAWGLIAASIESCVQALLPMAHVGPPAARGPSCEGSLPQFPHWQQESLHCFSAAKGVGRDAGAALRTEGAQWDEGGSGPCPPASCRLRAVPSRAAPSRAVGGRCGRACGRSPFCGAAPRCRPRPAEPGRAPPLSAAPSRAGLSHAGAAAMYGEFPLEPGRAGAVRAPPGLPGTWGSPSPPPPSGVGLCGPKARSGLGGSRP